MPSLKSSITVAVVLLAVVPYRMSPYDTEEMLEAMRIFLEEQEGEQK